MQRPQPLLVPVQIGLIPAGLKPDSQHRQLPKHAINHSGQWPGSSRATWHRAESL